MKNKGLYIGIGIIALVGIIYFIRKNKNYSQAKTSDNIEKTETEEKSMSQTMESGAVRTKANPTIIQTANAVMTQSQIQNKIDDYNIKLNESIKNKDNAHIVYYQRMIDKYKEELLSAPLNFNNDIL
jgi:hypothetical protein